MIKKLLILGFLFSLCPTSFPKDYAYIDSLGMKPDLFMELGTIIGILDQFENNKYAGVKVDFDCNGRYYSRYKGSNWWEYYFKKLDVGNTTGESKRIPSYEKIVLSACVYELSSDRAHELIKKYIKVQPEIINKVRTYQKESFSNSFVIGVHYKKNESSPYATPKVSYKKLYDILLVHITEKSNLKIFVHTNDKRFYSFLKTKHPDIVFEYTGQANFKMNAADEGEYELINCLLLSQTNLLICTPSRFTITISQFNPSIPVIKLN